MRTNVTAKVFLVLFFLLLLGSSVLLAQAEFVLSKSSDFSTDDRIFTRSDTMYMKVVAPDIDFTDIDENEFRLKPDINDNNDFEGSFQNLLNGTYVAKLGLSTADPNEDNWKWAARIKDKGGREFGVEVEVRIVGGAGQEQVIEFLGAIDSVGQEAVFVNGIQILVNNETDIIGKENEVLNLSDLAVGDLIDVRAVVDEIGQFFATRIRVKAGIGDDVELRGKIESLGVDSIVVLGVSFLVDDNTEVLNNNNELISFNNLAAGQIVEIRALIQQDGSFLATRIKVEDGNDDEVEFTGHIEELGAERIVVDGVEFLVSGATEILDNDNNLVSLSDLQTGQLVQIRGERDNNGVLHATKIKIEDEGLGDDEVEIKGPVTAIGEDELIVLGLLFETNESTQVLDEDNNSIDLSDIQVGFVVQVRADVLNDGTLLATKIKIEDRFGNQIEIKGVIEEIGQEAIVVLGFEFLVTNQTEVLDDDGDVIEFSDLERGMVVEIKAEVQANGSLVAIRIKVEDDFSGRVEITGTIDAIDGEALRVSGIVFLVSGETEILDTEGNLITFGDLQVGQIVEIKGTVQADGTILATRVKVEDRIVDEVETTGVIEQLTDLTITVLGRTFLLTDNTAVFDVEENMIDVSGLFVGQTVEIRGDLLTDGTLIALRIKLQDQGANEINVVGPIDSFGPGTVEVVGIVFFVNENTAISNKDGAAIQLSDLNAGETVEVVAEGQPNGTRVANQIKIEDILLLAGTVDNVVFNGIEMLGKKVLIDANTLVLGKENKFLSVNDLAQGQFVEVRALQNGNNIVFGTKVKIQGNVITSVSGSPGNRAQPEDFVLLQNYPNPFNPSTTITFTIPESGQLVTAQLTIFNLLGQKVRTLLSQPLTSGTYQRLWDGRDDNGNVLPTGVYIYRLEAGSIAKTQRMLLIK